MASAVLRAAGGFVLVLTAVAFCACGGADHGRPKPNAPALGSDAGADPDTTCAAAGDLTLLGIANFEPPAAGASHLVPTVGSCSTAVPCSMYYNFDQEQSPHVCDDGTSSLATCVQADGTAEPAAFCMTTNLPAPAPSVIVTQIPDGRCDASNFAFHLGGTNIAGCYDPVTRKVGWGATLQITFTSSFDASTWTGISFWEKRGPASSQGAILVNIQDNYTLGGACESVAAPEPAILGKPPAPDALKCDPFGLAVGLDEDWTLVRIPFAKTQQKGFGMPSPLGRVDQGGITGLQVVLSSGDWDVWVDDIAFYREPS